MKRKHIISKLLIAVILVIASFSFATINNTALNSARMTGLELDEVDRIKAMLKSSDPFVRADASQELGELAHPDATEPLISALTDNSIYVRAYAAEALGKIKNTRAIDPLVAALNDEDEFVQTHIIHSLGEIRDSKAVTPLIDLLNSEKDVVKTRAAWALGEIRDPKAVDALITALNDEVCCDYAAEALKKITEQDFGTDHEKWQSWWLSTDQTL